MKCIRRISIMTLVPEKFRKFRTDYIWNENAKHLWTNDSVILLFIIRIVKVQNKHKNKF